MANSPRITASCANAMLDAGIGSVSNGGKLLFYDGTQPAAGGGTATNLLATLTLNADAFPSASSNQLAANAITGATISASGTATWARLTAADGTTPLIDLSVGKTAGYDINLDENVLVQGGTLAINSLTITHPLL